MKKITKIAEKIGKVLLILMLSFSQLSFPLEVLADELTQTAKDEPIQEELTENDEVLAEDEILEDEGEEIPEESTDNKYKVTLNGEEVTEYTIAENEDKVITINQEYQGEEGTYTFDNKNEILDFTNMLYGDYQYTYSVSGETGVLESKIITVHYKGDNSTILNKYSNATYQNGKYLIKGTSTNLTVIDGLNYFDQEELANTYLANLMIVDSEENLLTDTDIIKNGYQLILTNGIITEKYFIQIIGDYNDDDIVNEEDAKVVIDKILNNEINDQNEGNIFNILDATNPVFTTGSWDNNILPIDNLTNSLVNKTEINNGEELEVKYYINGFEQDKLTGIEGKVNYNKALLELTNITINSLYGNINEEGKFAYLLDNYNSNDILITLTFKAIGVGEANISIDNILASTGLTANLDNNSISTTITIVDYGKGGDQQETVVPAPITQPEPVKTTEIPKTTTLTTTEIKNVSLSSDKTIKSLTIKGHNIDFDRNTYEYSIKVKNNVKSLDLTIILNNENASYIVEGNENFKVGDNTVNINVKAEDGSTQTYTIKVTKEAATETSDEEEEKEENSSSKTVIIILIVLVIIGLIYVIFKDDEEDKKESKK